VLILLADDDPVQTLLLTKRLKQQGYKVDSAINAIQAWTVASRRPPDAIILDIQMPNGSGYAVLKQMKSSSRTMRVPVIVLSGSIDSSDKVKLKELGADVCLSKPVDLAHLFATLSNLLQQPATTGAEMVETAVASSPGLDADALLQYVEGDVDLLRELARTFWESCPTMLNGIRDALESASPKALEAAAHALKGSLGYFGKSVALHAARKLEMLGREGSVDGAAGLFAILEEGLAELKAALEAFEASPGPTEHSP